MVSHYFSDIHAFEGPLTLRPPNRFALRNPELGRTPVRPLRLVKDKK